MNCLFAAYREFYACIIQLHLSDSGIPKQQSAILTLKQMYYIFYRFVSNTTHKFQFKGKLKVVQSIEVLLFQSARGGGRREVKFSPRKHKIKIKTIHQCVYITHSTSPPPLLICHAPSFSLCISPMQPCPHF